MRYDPDLTPMVLACSREGDSITLRMNVEGPDQGEGQAERLGSTVTYVQSPERRLALRRQFFEGEQNLSRVGGPGHTTSQRLCVAVSDTVKLGSRVVA